MIMLWSINLREVAGINRHQFSLSGTLNQKAAAKTFKKIGRVLIPNILEKDGADLLLQHVSTMPEMNLVFRNQQKHYDLSANGFENLDPEDKADIQNSVYSCAQREFGYMYKNYPISDLVQSGNCSALLRDFLEFLNTKSMLDALRRITGFQNIDYVDAQATRFDPGHFLTSHNDSVDGKNRLAAYVLNLSPRWHPDWGGNLMLYDDENNVMDVFVPKMNSLSLFAVGTQHAVSLVSPFARRPRVAITGWLRFH